jgi:pimeloyl-ACP methyl ester carboxylesterase
VSPNAGHWLCEENPREVERLLLDFFSSRPAGSLNP